MREQQELKRKLDQQRVQLQDSVWQQVFASLCLALWSLPELHILWRILFADVRFINYSRVFAVEAPQNVATANSSSGGN
jgi:hypothetical protein